MGRAKLVRLSVRLANSLPSTRQPGIHWLRLTQVTRYSSLIRSPPLSFVRNLHSFYVSLNFHKKLYFSSKPESSVELILCNDWSDKIENELEKMNPNLTHEFVVYVLRKLNKNPKKCLQFFKWVRDRKGFELSFVPYWLMIRSLAGKEFMDEFWTIASEMKEKGFCIDRNIYLAINKVLKEQKLDEQVVEWIKFYETLSEDDGENDVSKDVVDVIMGSDWTEEMEIKLKRLNFQLSQNFILKVVYKLREDPFKALKFFQWVKRDTPFEHNSVTYQTMARVLSGHQLFDELWDLLTRMRSDGYEIDFYIKFAKFFKNEDRVKLYEFVMDGPYKLSEQECIWLLKTLVKDPDLGINLVTRVLNKYVAMGNTITKAIYDLIHGSLCKVGRFDEAKKIVDQMRSAGYEPDDLNFSQEVFGFCKLGMFEDASQAINRMEATGCAPGIKTWTTLIKGYCAAGELNQALSSFTHMLGKKIEPDAVIMQVLIDGFLSHNRLFCAYKLLVEMVNKARVKPWSTTYKLMIDKLVQSGKLEEALVLLNMMKQHKYDPHRKPVGVYISKFGTVEDAKKFLKALSSKGGSASPAAYVKMISAFYEEGRHSEAKELLYSSPQHVHNYRKIQDMHVWFSSD